ncbi:MAG: flagellar hook-associated protein 1 FlgK [Chlamydiales bacterium]|jgi:flagellar hook-associated protein 1 FlgK
MASASLNLGLKALLSSQAALDTIGHNIANANTPGYTRQSLVLQSGRSTQLRGLQMGGGVEAESVKRTVDDFINKRLFTQTSMMKHIEARLGALSDTESLLGEPSGTGISDLLGEMFSKLAELSTSPTDGVAQTATVTSIGTVTSQIRDVGTQMDAIGTEVVGRVKLGASQINALADGVAEYNRRIITAESGGAAANDLRDQRDQLVREISEQIGVTVVDAPSGTKRVFMDGQMLVGDQSSNDLLVSEASDGSIRLMLAGGTQPVEARSGSIGGLISYADTTLPELRSDLDRLAQGLILEMNRRHSQGTPPSGGFGSLVSDKAIVDTDGDGSVLNERLGSLDGPIDAVDGELFVQVRNEATGEVQTHRVKIDASRMNVGEFLAELSALPQLSANADTLGRIRIQAATGFTFDFSRSLEEEGNSQGNFGGASASLTSAGGAPFALTPGDTLTLDSGSGSFGISFNPADFANMSQVTAQEVAAVINADVDTAANGMRAIVSGDQIVLQSIAEGSAVSFDVVGGSAATAFGWSAGTTVSGQDRSVSASLQGSYTGTTNKRLTFRASMDGDIGSTPGLAINVFDANGTQVTSLDVGADYLPGTELTMPDGMSITFSSGTVSATDGDSFTRHLLADSDTSDVLVALGLNGLLTGTDATSIGVTQRVLDDPRLLATTSNGASGGNAILRDLLALQNEHLEGLQESIGGFYAGLVGNVGLQVQSADRALEIEGQLMASLETRRDQVSGVSLDEELVNLIQFEQAFGAAARFIQVVGALQDEVLNLL